MLCALYYVVLTDLMRTELVDNAVVVSITANVIIVVIVCVGYVSVLSDTGIVRVVSK